MPLVFEKGIPKKLHRNVIKFVRFERRWKTSSREWTTYGPPPPINVNRCFVVGCAKLAGVTVTKCAAVREWRPCRDGPEDVASWTETAHAQGYLWLCSCVDESMPGSMHSRPIFSRVRVTRERRVLPTNEDDLGEIIETRVWNTRRVKLCSWKFKILEIYFIGKNQHLELTDWIFHFFLISNLPINFLMYKNFICV